ncbi:hypothetical protein ADEAN_000420700 [Angomonas deanei]|uniref:Uncharacterized protein n=1 Tax=Angomonas deanei TaxID=59799 RepID=A0A7G2CD06_9TRYP|nr:hypothetical protein ADEAN_000420700 [Angomonas deanei]
MFSVEDATTTLCRSVVAAVAFRVKGPTEQYRCKATYSLTPQLSVSNLVMPEVNRVAAVVEEFRTVHSRFVKRFPRFFHEVMVKISRKGEFIIKVVFLNSFVEENDKYTLQEELGITVNESETVYEVWARSEDAKAFVDYLSSKVEMLVGVVAHVSLPSQQEEHLTGVKPDKTSAYIPLFKEDVITEYTPNNVPYTLFCDSFCEVNQPMEDEIYHTIVEFLDLNTNRKRGGLFSGRDVNSVYFTFKEYYSDTTTITTCPNVFEDTKRNGIACQLTRKDLLFEKLQDSVTRPASEEEQMHILITAGRHGLHPDTCKELVELSVKGKVTDVVYVSCNVESYARDMYILKEGYRTHHVRSFDFFPGTNYVMTVVHFRSLLLEPLRGNLLVLPIGVPGVGKSTFGGLLKKAFLETQNPPAPTQKQKKTTPVPQSQSFIPRTFAVIPSNVQVQYLQRDALFRECRDNGCSLRESRKRIEEEVYSRLSDGHRLFYSEEKPTRLLLYYDSTNGSAEARLKYRQSWSGRESASWLEGPSLELYFAYSDRQKLLERLQQRKDHPSFPEDAQGQDDKLKTIETVFDEMDTVEAISGSSLVRFCCDSGNTEKESLRVALLAVCAHLYFTNDIAHVLLSPEP